VDANISHASYKNHSPVHACFDAKSWRTYFVSFQYELSAADSANLQVCKSLLLEHTFFFHSFGNKYAEKDPPKAPHGTIPTFPKVIL
jgi:hypothetical protein